MIDTLCDRPIALLTGEPSPFGRLIAFAYEDGPALGVIECRSGEAAYRFDLLAIDVDGEYDRAAWDRGEEIRVFGLAPLPVGAFAEAVEWLSQIEKPRWPVWMPGAGDKSGSDGDAVDRIAEAILRSAGPMTAVIAVTDLLGPMRSASPDPKPHGKVPDDWFMHLGIAAKEVAGGRV